MKRRRRVIARIVGAVCALGALFPLAVEAGNLPKLPMPVEAAGSSVRELDRAATSISVALPEASGTGRAGKTFHLPHSGERAWAARAASNNPRNPVAAEGRAIAGSGSGNKVYAWHLATGSRSWSVASNDSGISNLVYSGDSVYFTTWSCTLERVRVSTGGRTFVKWLAPTVNCAPDVGEEIVYAAYQKDGGSHVSAHSTSSGSQQWIKQLPVGAVQAPVACGDTVAIADTAGRVTSFSDSGDKLWERKLGAVSAPIATPRGLLIMHAAVSSDAAPKAEEKADEKPAEPKRHRHPDRITSSSREPVTDRGPGRVLATVGSLRLAVIDPRMEPMAGRERELTGPVASGLDYQGVRPGVNGELVVLAYENVIRAVDLDTGHTVWERKTTTRYGDYCEPAFGDGMVFLADEYGFVTALDQASGDVMWSYRFENTRFRAKPAFSDHRLVLTADNGSVVCLPTGLTDSTRDVDKVLERVRKGYEDELEKAGGTPAVKEQRRPDANRAKEAEGEAPVPASGPEAEQQGEPEGQPADEAQQPNQPPRPEPITKERWERIEDRKEQRAKAMGIPYKRKPWPGWAGQ